MCREKREKKVYFRVSLQFTALQLVLPLFGTGLCQAPIRALLALSNQSRVDIETWVQILNQFISHFKPALVFGIRLSDVSSVPGKKYSPLQTLIIIIMKQVDY